MTNGEGCGMWFDPAKFVAGVLIPPHVIAKRSATQETPKILIGVTKSRSHSDVHTPLPDFADNQSSLAVRESTV